MMSRWLCSMFFASVMLPAAAQTATSEPKDAMGWFTRAHDQMALRSPGSAPFHMKVAFHAFPGIEPAGDHERCSSAPTMSRAAF